MCVFLRHGTVVADRGRQVRGLLAHGFGRCACCCGCMPFIPYRLSMLLAAASMGQRARGNGRRASRGARTPSWQRLLHRLSEEWGDDVAWGACRASLIAMTRCARPHAHHAGTRPLLLPWSYREPRTHTAAAERCVCMGWNFLCVRGGFVCWWAAVCVRVRVCISA